MMNRDEEKKSGKNTTPRHTRNLRSHQMAIDQLEEEKKEPSPIQVRESVSEESPDSFDLLVDMMIGKK